MLLISCIGLALDLLLEKKRKEKNDKIGKNGRKITPLKKLRVFCDKIW